MNKRTKRNQKQASGPCLCQELGPAVRELMARVGPPPEARRHFEAARLEFLKGLRAVLDARIERVSRPRTKGEKISVE
jgi:hypothetical protein